MKEQENIVRTENKNTHAMILALCGIFLFSVVTALVKLMAEEYSVFLISFFRNFFALLPATLVVLWMIRQRKPEIRQWPVHIVRALFGFLSMICLFQAFHMIPLAEATIIYYTGPLFITVLAVLLLKEKVAARNWSAVLLGLGGVFLVIRPDETLFNIGVGFAFTGTVFYALAMISLRQLGKTEDPLMMSFIFALLATILSALFLPWSWETPTVRDLLPLAAIGLIAFIAQTLMSYSYIYAQASTLSPLIYTSLIWNALFGFLIWDDIPAFMAMAGMLVILVANLINKKKAKKPAALNDL